MKTMKVMGMALGAIGALALGACATMNVPGNSPTGASTNSRNVYAGFGVVQSIELVRQTDNAERDGGIGLGTIAGAVVGGVVGNQVGEGQGNTAATVIGAAGGAYVGHQLENQPRASADVYKITVRMDDGSYQALMQGSASGLRVGDRVRIENGVAQRYR